MRYYVTAHLRERDREVRPLPLHGIRGTALDKLGPKRHVDIAEKQHVIFPIGIASSLGSSLQAAPPSERPRTLHDAENESRVGL